MFRYLLLSFASILYCAQSFAGGVSLGATRLIYPTDKDQLTLKIYNTDETGNYLVQSWISDDKNNKISDFIITPPLFVIKSNTDNILKVVYTGDKDNLPKEKEKLYYFNSKVIPSLSEDEQKIDNALLISTTTKIKLFIRPDSIKENPLTSYKKIKCSYEKGQLKIDNPTPFYMNLVSIKSNGNEISKLETIAPREFVYLTSNINNKNITFSVINDYGVQIKDIQCNF
ncbi:fimbria/pilus periplasmic chaperone [Moellerella wisconsensis]|uniref:fimbrial biogenesis chaperone n=1 Tax=Moellerella wisconsensis TaxID=158849 RepID=UPI0025B01BD3|nr:fimbria/pilus periplasmic chaperone [Moellerella wisconsensis]WJW81991.1 fimbria/pilus periplasmic chaperone [Moellerella wisconsensis]